MILPQNQISTFSSNLQMAIYLKILSSCFSHVKKHWNVTHKLFNVIFPVRLVESFLKCGCVQATAVQRREHCQTHRPIDRLTIRQQQAFLQISDCKQVSGTLEPGEGGGGL